MTFDVHPFFRRLTLTDKRLEAAAKALAEKTWELEGHKQTWEKAAGYVRDGFRIEAAKILAVVDAVTPPDMRWTPGATPALEGQGG